MYNNMNKVPDEMSALDKCFRPFIIKCIQAIVQARSGNVYNTNCMSDVGARNNMMVYIEDDPEIGATIKQNLDSGFSVAPGDNFTVEIYGKMGTELPLLEVWHFSIESTTETNTNMLGNLADLKKTRFLERLGTLLKSIMVTTRLLPAYRNSRNPVSEDNPMCYLVRRGLPNLSNLGNHCQGRSVGCLVVPSSSVSLKVYTHYRSVEGIRLVREKQHAFVDAASQKIEESKSKMDTRRSQIPIKKNRPAFATNYVDHHDDEEDCDIDKLCRQFDRKCDGYKSSDNEQESENEIDDVVGDGPRKTRSETLLNAAMSTSPEEVKFRLQLPFSTLSTGADYSRMYNELKFRGDLDLFATDMSESSSRVDISYLKEELLLHEKTSVEFDDFLQSFEEGRAGKSLSAMD